MPRQLSCAGPSLSDAKGCQGGVSFWRRNTKRLLTRDSVAHDSAAVADVEGIAAEVAEESAGSSESGFERNGTRERRVVPASRPGRAPTAFTDLSGTKQGREMMKTYEGGTKPDVEGIAAEVAEESAGSSESGFERNGTRERRGRNHRTTNQGRAGFSTRSRSDRVHRLERDQARSRDDEAVEPVADVEGIAAEVAEESAGSSESGFERNGTRERPKAARGV
jgi:hypothetical protein